MRRLAFVFLVLAAMAVCDLVVSAHHDAAETPVAIYDSDPQNIWNRLHALIFIREDLPSTRRGADALDPPYWSNTRYLLAEPSHRQALRLLDEFLQTHAENPFRDPLKRALLQRDLWSVFDWSFERAAEGNKDRAYAKEKQELQVRLAEAMRRVALSTHEIQSLPNNYEQAAASGQFAAEYDPAHKDRPFLPRDLFDPCGPWVELRGPGDAQPVAEEHVGFFFERSSFLVFMRLPGGRKAAFDYLQTLWDFPEPTVPSPHFSPNSDVAPSPKLPQFPAGTEFALVRQLTLVDKDGRQQFTPITESVQFRVYETVAPEGRPAGISTGIGEAMARNGQAFYEFTLSRPQLFANKAGGLRATGRNERQTVLFGFSGPDHDGRVFYSSPDQTPPVLTECVTCHADRGLRSVRSQMSLLKPRALQRDEPLSDASMWWQDARVLSWKQRQENWALLSRYWRTSAPR